MFHRVKEKWNRLSTATAWNKCWVCTHRNEIRLCKGKSIDRVKMRKHGLESLNFAAVFFPYLPLIAAPASQLRPRLNKRFKRSARAPFPPRRGVRFYCCALKAICKNKTTSRTWAEAWTACIHWFRAQTVATTEKKEEKSKERKKNPIWIFQSFALKLWKCVWSLNSALLFREMYVSFNSVFTWIYKTPQWPHDSDTSADNFAAN